MKKRIVIAIVVILAGLMAWKLMSNKNKLDTAKQMPVASNTAIPVTVVKAQLETVNNSLSKTGKLIANKEADIPALTSGKLVSVNFALGSQVNQGAVVAQVDAKNMELNLTQAKLNKNKAEQDYNRFKRLLEGEATTESTFLDVKLNYENAQNQIAILEKQIADTRIKAPISGQIVTKNVEPGEFVAMGQPLGTIVDLSRLKVTLMVSESEVYELKLNQAVNVTTDIYPTETFEGKITFISGKGDATLNYEVEITLENNKKDKPLKAGTLAYVNFQKTTDNLAIVLPRSCLVEGIKTPYVYVVKGDILEKRAIVIAKDMGNAIVVKEGIQVDDIVVSSGLVNVREGSKVSMITATPSTTDTRQKQ